MKRKKKILCLSIILISGLWAGLLLDGNSINGQEIEPRAAVATRNEKSEAIDVSSQIEKVIVYPNQAQIIRKGVVSVFPETRSLVFRGLPGTIIPGSVRFLASGSAPVKILGVESEKVFLEAAELPEVKKIQAEISGVEAEIESLKGQEAVLEAQEKFLNSFGTALSNQISKELLAGRPDLTGVDKFVDYLGSRLQTIKSRREENARSLAQKQAKLDALREKLKEILPERLREQTRIKVLIETAQTTKLQVELNYAVRPASWTPAYTIKALPESDEIELTIGAIVTQRTGENWENVRLALSTVRPTAGNQPGELLPWYLDFIQPRLMKAAARDLAESRMAVAAEAAAPVMALEETAETAETWLGANFEIKKPWTILSDGAERRLPVDSQKFQASFDYLSIPKLQERVFLRSSFKNTMPYPLLHGKADMFIDRDFVGPTRLPDIPVNDELKLFFGEDNQVRVKRELVKREKSAPGFLGKNEKTTQVFRITLENLRHRLVEVEVQDQIPVSQNSRIEVKDVKIAPSPSSRDEKGIITWKLQLKPGQKQQLTLEFTVEYPKGSRVDGI